MYQQLLIQQVQEIVEIKLTDEELAGLQKSAQLLQAFYPQLDSYEA